MKTNNARKNACKLLPAIITSLLLMSTNSFPQDSQKEKSVSSSHDMQGMKPMKQETSAADTEIERKGIIDLTAIDKNKDGKVFQDQMDWNVISDKPGKCPLCKMKLKEVSLKVARKNLLENGFKVK